MKKVFFTILGLLIFIQLASQSVSKISGERVYLHTDKANYVQGDKIWFRAYLLNSNMLDQTELSSYVYVELIKDSVISRVKIKKSDSGYSGYLNIPETLTEGDYKIRAYTRWMQNFPLEYYFLKNIRVTSREAVPPKEIVTLSSNRINSPPDLQFFPEGGIMIVGENCKIAFKALGSDGKSVPISGKIFSNSGENLGSFESKHNGMGLFSISNIDENGYYVYAEYEGSSYRYELPKPVNSGVTLSLNKVRDIILINSVNKNNNSSDSLILILSDESGDYLNKKIGPEYSTSRFKVSDLPKGINSVRITNKDSIILAERLFFNHSKSYKTPLVTLNRDTFASRDLVSAKVDLKEISSTSEIGNFSVAVINSENYKDSLERDNILSFIKLSSYLKGNIEDPAYYFKNINAEKERYLDMLLLTQGWRVYNNISPQFSKEMNQAISGSITGLFGNSVKNKVLMIYSPKINYSGAFILTDKSSFTVENIDFEDSTSFVLAVSGKNGGQLYGLNLDEPTFPKVLKSRLPLTRVLKSDTLKTESMVKKVSAQIQEENFQNRKLSEIYVVAPSKDKYTPKHNPSPFMQSFSRTQLREREYLKNFDQMYIQDYLVYNYPGLYFGNNEMGERVIYSSRGITMSGPTEPMLFVDRLQWQSTSQLEAYSMMVMDAENIAFLSGNEAFMFRSTSGVILITTRQSSLPAGEKVRSNIRKITPLGFQKRVEFYSPKYETDTDRASTTRDLRQTLYWNPCVKSNASGIADFEFYTDDSNKGFVIKIEGIMSDGEAFIATKVVEKSLSQASKLP